MIFSSKVCWKAIFYHENIDLHPAFTDLAAQVGRKGVGHPVFCSNLLKSIEIQKLVSGLEIQSLNR